VITLVIVDWSWVLDDGMCSSSNASSCSSKIQFPLGWVGLGAEARAADNLTAAAGGRAASTAGGMVLICKMSIYFSESKD
jgi:hypothetical protein